MESEAGEIVRELEKKRKRIRVGRNLRGKERNGIKEGSETRSEME